MRVQNILGVGLIAVAAAACSNPANDATAGLDQDLLSELQPALFSSSASPETAVLSALELSPADKGEAALVSRRPSPGTVPAAVHHLAEIAEPEATIIAPVLTAAPASAAVITAPVAAAGMADHAGHGAAEESRAGGGVMIRGALPGRDPCIIHPGGVPAMAEAGIGGVRNALGPSRLGPVGVMVNDQSPRVGRSGGASYGGADRGSSPGSVFIR